jgi:hypothetical protein
VLTPPSQSCDDGGPIVFVPAGPTLQTGITPDHDGLVWPLYRPGGDEYDEHFIEVILRQEALAYEIHAQLRILNSDLCLQLASRFEDNREYLRDLVLETCNYSSSQVSYESARFYHDPMDLTHSFFSSS